MPHAEPELAPDQEPVDPAAAAEAVRTRRLILVVLLVIALIGVGLAVTWQRAGLWTPSWGGREGAVCPVQMMSPAEPEDTKVNVYNASDREGIGAITAKELASRGFREGAVTNAKLDERTQGATGLIVTGPGTLEQALAVQRQVPQARVVIQPARSDGAVDLILGDAFTRLQPKRHVSDAPGRMTCVRQAFAG